MLPNTKRGSGSGHVGCVWKDNSGQAEAFLDVLHISEIVCNFVDGCIV